jgi:aminoglycoside/choline kinase family phosphotransferase
MNDSQIISLISSGHSDIFGKRDIEVVPLPRSGSDRRYYRIRNNHGSIIAAFNNNFEENEAFIGFSHHFKSKSLPVPEILGYLPEKSVYYLQDLGDDNLYTWLHKRPVISPLDGEASGLYKKILETLVVFQTRGIEGLNLDLCYPHRSFDRQSMMWDMNYFKYMLLKLLAVPFNERRLEQDFNSLADYLLETGQDYFLYRDFQTANVMVVDKDPWFIDYQGGRKGAPQYDVASMLYDAKIPMRHEDRELLLDHYIECFCSETGEDRDGFRGYYSGFSMIRVMQALGAFGFRGLYEQKPTFTDSIVPGVILLNEITERAQSHINLAELYNTVKAIPSTPIFEKLAKKKTPEILL